MTATHLQVHLKAAQANPLTTALSISLQSHRKKNCF